MKMTNKTLTSYLVEYFNWQFAPTDINTESLGEDLARRLEQAGYCKNNNFNYEMALCCSINKKHEKDCLVFSCPNNDFCRLLRGEGYIK